MSKMTKTYDVSIASCIDSVSTAVNDAISNIKQGFGALEEDTQFELTVVLNELVLNAIKHGNKHDESKRVKIKVGVTSDGFACLIIEDEGCGYNYGCMRKRKAECEEDDDICNILESGRGMLIVRNLCDQVKVNEKGNKVVVLKKLN